MTSRFSAHTPSYVLIVMAAFGCSGDGSEGTRVPVYPARGQVVFKGVPLADALVVLQPAGTDKKDGNAPQPTGRTDAEGKFALHTYAGNDGAPVGSYLVGISASPAYPETRNVMEKQSARRTPASALPGGKYADPAKSGLVAEIKAGENLIPAFDLK